jgi:hypothetical protein
MKKAAKQALNVLANPIARDDAPPPMSFVVTSAPGENHLFLKGLVRQEEQRAQHERAQARRQRRA